MDELSKLAIKYGADKWGKHHYTPVYFDLFKDRRNEVKKVLEIGVAEGASLFMWRDFFVNAYILGAEIEDKRLFSDAIGRINCYKCDQSSKEDLENLIKQTGSDIDLVVDDGSHKPGDQLFTCLTLMPLLDKYVVYVIEDIATVGVAVAIEEALKDKYYCQTIKVGKRYDDRLIIVRHKDG